MCLQAGAFGEGRQQGRLTGRLDQRLLLIVERAPSILIDQELEHRLGLVPARHIDQLDVILQTLAQIDGGGEELRGIDLVLAAAIPETAFTPAPAAYDFVSPEVAVEEGVLRQ